MKPAWLPDLVNLNDYNGDWDRYIQVLYSFYKLDFIDSKPIYEGKRLAVKRHPVSYGKDATFWHIISSGRSEDSRFPDLRRCERIKWPKQLIENSNDSLIKVWKNTRNGETRIILWLESGNYAVILAERTNYILFWTAFLVTREHQKRKFRKEYEKYWRNKANKG